MPFDEFGSQSIAQQPVVQKADDFGFVPTDTELQSSAGIVTFEMLITDMMVDLSNFVGLLFFFLLLWRCRKWSSLIIIGAILIGALEFFLYHINSVINTPANLITDFFAFMIDLCILRLLQKGFVKISHLKTKAQRIALLSLLASLLLIMGQLIAFRYYGGSYDFWEQLSYCLSLGDTYRSCYRNNLVSRSFMLLNFIWLFASFICVVWWKYVISIKRWVEIGTYDK